MSENKTPKRKSKILEELQGLQTNTTAGNASKALDAAELVTKSATMPAPGAPAVELKETGKGVETATGGRISVASTMPVREKVYRAMRVRSVDSAVFPLGDFDLMKDANETANNARNHLIGITKRTPEESDLNDRFIVLGIPRGHSKGPARSAFGTDAEWLAYLETFDSNEKGK